MHANNTDIVYPNGIISYSPGLRSTAPLGSLRSCHQPRSGLHTLIVLALTCTTPITALLKKIYPVLSPFVSRFDKLKVPSLSRDSCLRVIQSLNSRPFASIRGS